MADTNKQGWPWGLILLVVVCGALIGTAFTFRDSWSDGREALLASFAVSVILVGLYLRGSQGGNTPTHPQTNAPQTGAQQVPVQVTTKDSGTGLVIAIVLLIVCILVAIVLWRMRDELGWEVFAFACDVTAVIALYLKITRDDPVVSDQRMRTLPAVPIIIAFTFASYLALRWTWIYMDKIGNMWFLFTCFLIVVFSVVLYHAIIYTKKNTVTVLVDDLFSKGGGQKAVGGSGYIGPQLKWPWYKMESLEDVVSLQRVQIKDFEVTGTTNPPARVRVKISGNYAPDVDRAVEWRRLREQGVTPAIEGAFSAAVAAAIKQCTLKQAEGVTHLQKIVQDNMAGRNDEFAKHQTTNGLLRDWPICDVVINVETVRQTQDMLAVEEGRTQARIINSDIGREISAPAKLNRSSPAYRGLLHIIREERAKNKLPALASKEEEDAAVAAEQIKRQGMLTQQETIAQSNVIANQAKGINISGNTGGAVPFVNTGGRNQGQGRRHHRRR